MAKIPSISEMQKLTETNYVEIVEAELLKVIAAMRCAARNGKYYVYLEQDLLPETIEALKKEEYFVRMDCNEYGVVGTSISWSPEVIKYQKHKEGIFNF